MKSSRTDLPPPDLSEARALFERWRRERGGQTRIPPELWNTAVALVPIHGVTRVSTTLRLSFAELKRRSTADPLPATEAASVAPSVSFLALPPGLTLEHERRGACLELTHRSGATLRLTLPDTALDLPAVVTAFVSHRQPRSTWGKTIE